MSMCMGCTYYGVLFHKTIMAIFLFNGSSLGDCVSSGRKLGSFSPMSCHALILYVSLES